MKKLYIWILALSLFKIYSGSTHESAGLPQQHWSFNTVTGTFDKAALQRGYQVYKEICSACHGLKLLSFRHLKAIGFSDAEIKSLAAQYEITDGPNDEGQMYQRPGLPSDRFVSPFANDQAARAANNGALPPDLSLMVKARKGGADYVYALLTGYQEPPAEMKIMPGMHYNPYFPGGQIAMPPPLHEGMVHFADNSPQTVEQMACDVVTFLAWTAEPDLEARKRLGFKVLIFLGFFVILMYAAMKRIWRNVH